MFMKNILISIHLKEESKNEEEEKRPGNRANICLRYSQSVCEPSEMLVPCI